MDSVLTFLVLAIIYGEALLKGVTFSDFRYMKELGVSLVEVYEKVKRLKRGNVHFMAVKRSRKRSGFVIYSYFKDSAFIAVKSYTKL